MNKVRFIRSMVMATVMLTAAHSGLRAQTSTPGASLSLEEVIKLCQDGFSEEVIVTKIKKHNRPFDLGPEELAVLKKLGIDDTIIRLLIDPSQPYSPPAPPPPPAAAPAPPALPAPVVAPKPPMPEKHYPKDPHAASVPAEPGLYRFAGDVPESIDVKILLSVKEGPGLGKLLLKKGHTIGYLVGPTAKTRSQSSAPVLYLRLPEGKGAEEVLLVALEKGKKRREVEMGAGPKPEMPADLMRPFDYVEVGLHLFRIAPAKLAKGEYLFFLVGTAEPPKGSLGKGYEFGIGVAAGKK